MPNHEKNAPHDIFFSSYSEEKKFIADMRKKYGSLTENNLEEILRNERPDIAEKFPDLAAEVRRSAELRDKFAASGKDLTAKNIAEFLKAELTDEEKERVVL